MVPSATEIVCALGLEDALVGVTHECDHPPSARAKPVVVESALPQGLDSAGIDAEARAAAREGRSLYRINAALARELRPDVVVTQALCEVCAASRPEVEALVAALGYRPRVVTLTPTTLDEALEDVVRVGDATSRRKEAEALVAELRGRVRAVERAVRGAPRPRVACLEWLAPPMHGGHWVPDMVARAGGVDALAEPGHHARAVTWQGLRDAAPEALFLMPCGFDVARALREGPALLARPELRGLPAVRAGRVYALDANAHFSRPGPRLVDGLEVLAAALHPGLVPQRFPWACAPLAPGG